MMPKDDNLTSHEAEVLGKDAAETFWGKGDHKLYGGDPMNPLRAMIVIGSVLPYILCLMVFWNWGVSSIGLDDMTIRILGSFPVTYIYPVLLVGVICSPFAAVYTREQDFMDAGWFYSFLSISSLLLLFASMAIALPVALVMSLVSIFTVYELFTGAVSFSDDYVKLTVVIHYPVVRILIYNFFDWFIGEN